MSPKTPSKRSAVVASIPGASAGLWSNLLPELEAYGYSKDDIFAVHLAMEEAFINAVNHGNDFDLDKKIKIEYLVDMDKIELTLTDEGKGFNPEKIPDPRKEENRYKTNGRGLLLMRSYMDSVEYNKSGNSVHMVRHKRRPD